ncbi:hypothetical protein CK203_045149 [Vitis vinifera]|uniref:Protein HGH1 homolog n=1 Tax=Vitis vinifera TaxID=29760 RepID=A0A438HD18_VITVI|nr:hypothetical protein CK203_045149 [Vitis vinifera]
MVKVSGMIRNCCFEAETQLENLLLISEFLWPTLLLPVAGSKVYSEHDTSKMPLELGSALSIEREPVGDPEIRVQALESLYLISLQEAGRRALWSVNGPRILQVGYEDEEDPKVMEAFEQVGSLIGFTSSPDELNAGYEKPLEHKLKLLTSFGDGDIQCRTSRFVFRYHYFPSSNIMKLCVRQWLGLGMEYKLKVVECISAGTVYC